MAGMGGAGFPTHVKLAPKNRERSNCDRELRGMRTLSDFRLPAYGRGTGQPDRRMKVILSLFPNARGVLAVEDNKPEAIRLLKERAAGETRISVAKLPTNIPRAPSVS